jgi:exopolysaccharide production protein ExoQ
MRKVPGSMRAAEANPRGTNRRIGPAIGRVAGGGVVVVLSILFWSIFYQNLPPNLGLHGPNTLAVTEGDISYANTSDRILKLCMIAISVYVIASRWSLTRSLAKNTNLGAAVLLTLAPLSAVWSISPSDTLLRSVSLAAIVLVCFAVSLAGWHPQRFQQLALPPLMFILVVSLLLGIVFPDEITEFGDDLSLRGAWHGITLTKNQFGMTASLGVIICAARWLAQQGRASWSIAGGAVAFVCLILSRSNTSLIATMLCLLVMMLVIRVPVIKQRYSTHLTIAIAATLLLYEMAIQNVIPGAYTLLSPITELTGKDATLSARTIIWDIIKDHVQYAPYLGTGYGAYWIGPVIESPSYVFTYRMYFYPTEAHNGYLDIVNDLGYLGLACLLVFIVSYIRQALQLMRTDRSQAALYLALLFQQMVMNMSESEWLARDSIFVILLLGTACLSRALRDVRLQAPLPVSPAR